MDKIEQEIQSKCLAAPRVTLADIEAEISSEDYFTAGQGVMQVEGVAYKYVETRLHMLTFCVLTMRNGFTVTGESACASPENFDADLGRKIARMAAIKKCWPLLGYQLRTELSRPTLTEADALADLEGRPRPDWKGV